MHGFGLGSTVLVNAEVDSMGGIVDVGVGIGTKPSPRRAAIEKAQAELRLEYDVREERRRELEFLEKGGDPLDFKFGHAASVSVQSTSRTDQHADQNLTSEAKGSFALTASPHGDSVESSGRLGVTVACEPNSADNFDGDNEILQNDRKSMHPGRSSTAPSEYISQIGVCRNVKDSEDSPIFHPKKGQAYRRRNRFRANSDGPRSSSADMASSGGHGSTHARNVVHSKPVASENQLEKESDDTLVMHASTARLAESAEEKISLSNSKEKLEEVQNIDLKADDAPVSVKIVEPDTVVGKASIDTVDVGCPPFGGEKEEDNATSSQLNETSMINGDNNCTPTDALVKDAPVTMKGLDSETSCTQANVSVDGIGNNDGDLCPNLQNVDTNGIPKEPTLPVEEISVSRDEKLPNEEHITNALEMASCIKKDKDSINVHENGFAEENHAETLSGNSQHDCSKGVSNAECQESHADADMKSETELARLDDSISKRESSCPVGPLVDSNFCEVNKNDLSGAPAPPALKSEPFVDNQPKPLDEAQEDKILEEAQMIEAKRKRIAELSVIPLPRENRRKCHWDLVLEEVAWLANDFAQERLWKMTAAAQICRRIAFASRLRLEEQNKISKQKSVAHTLAKAVMGFWHSARICVENADSSSVEICKHETLSGIQEMDKASSEVLQSTGKKQDRAVHGYAVRFLQYNCSLKPFVKVEVPEVTVIPCDVDLPEIAWQDRFTEENLFYAIPPGAMEMYRKSIESHLAECERVGNNIREEVDTSGNDAVAGCGYEDNDFEEDEGENLYYLPGTSDTGKPSKKKSKNKKLNAARSYEFGGDFGYGHCAETRNGTSQVNIMGKRPANSLHVDPIPTKRMRTASRQRVVGPFGAGSTGFTPVLSRAEASSGDTNSFQDDQSALHGGSVFPRGSEVDSAMNFEKQSKFDSAEMSAKPKKKKKIKHQSVSYDQRWQLDSSMQIEQKELVRKRLDNHQLESNGNSGSFGPLVKRQKLAKHPLENSFDKSAPMSGSVASPVASQMSNMSSQTKIIKFIGGRDRGKKGKGLKMSSGQLGSGSPWTIVEDQALVVLVHDMGPNWELVSDAINNILQFKCIFRKPQECKERHKFLMDKPSGDGADSAEDSGSSQPYPSTLPGIPKGSARQLFRSLHAHVEEDNIKSRFEKIIRIEQQHHFRKKKSDNHGLKQIAPVHGSHALSLSQVIPNNLNGGVLTPLDLCDTVTSNHDPLSIVSQSSHAGGSSLPNQSNIPPMHPPGGLNSLIQDLQGSPSMGVGNNLASPPSQLTSSRDARYSIPRSGTLPVEEQQRLQYNSILPGRNVQASALSSSGSISGSDRGVRMHPGGSGANMKPVANRSIPMVRPGSQGNPSVSMMDSGSALPSNLGGVPSNMNAHSGASSGHGNTMFRPRDSLHSVRSVQSSEHQRQVLPEMQMKTTQTNSTGGLGSGFSNQIASSPLPTYPGHYAQLSRGNHAITPEQQAYIRAAREGRIQQQRLLQRQHLPQQHPSSSPLVTRIQTQSPLPTSSSTLQGSSNVQSTSSSQPLTSPSPTPSSPLMHVVLPPQQQQKNIQGHGLGGQSGPGLITNQGGKQRQQYQQSGRQHPQQRQQSQAQQAKLVKAGRSSMLTAQNLPVDSSHLNGTIAKTASQVSEKGDTALNLTQDQNLYPGSTTTTPLAKTLPSHLQPQKQCINTGSPATSKTVQQTSSHFEGVNQGQAQGPSPTASGSNQDPSSSVVQSRNHQQSQRQHPALQKTTSQQNRQVNSDSSTKLQVGHSHVKQKSLSAGPPSTSVNSALALPVSSSVSTVVRKVQDLACDSNTASVPSPSDPVTNSFVNKPSSSVSQGLIQKHESQLQPPPLQPISPQNQSQQ